MLLTKTTIKVRDRYVNKKYLENKNLLQNIDSTIQPSKRPIHQNTNCH